MKNAKRKPPLPQAIKKFIREYRSAYATLCYQRQGHTGSCQARDCKPYTDGFRYAFDQLPKPP